MLDVMADDPVPAEFGIRAGGTSCEQDFPVRVANGRDPAGSDPTPRRRDPTWCVDDVSRQSLNSVHGNTWIASTFNW